jgi:hypothetical protein
VLISIDATRALQRFQQQPYHALIVDVANAGEQSLEPFEKVMREAASMGLGFSGFLIFNPGQEALAKRYGEKPGIVAMYLPAKELLGELKQRVPVEQGAGADGAST